MVHKYSISKLVSILKESTANKNKFCFILGSGASVTSGIPMGRTLEKRWLDCLMGESSDGNSDARDPKDTKNDADTLFSDGKIDTTFEELEKAWRASKELGNHIPSKYYFDIYKLRFYPDMNNGYAYLSQLMEKAKPSVGYHPLARLLAEDNGIDVVITTNFDSLTEDALFMFTEKRPLVVAHESLAKHLDPDRQQRPIVAKVHRGLFYEPMNDKESTSELSEGWKAVLRDLFKRYIPIVIGYAGGDKSLMSFLNEKDTRMKAIYWCLMKGEEPAEKVEELVASKRGMFFEISGFDDAMLTIGEAFLGDSIIPTKTGRLLENNARERFEDYYKQWAEWKRRGNECGAERDRALERLTEAEKKDEEEREKKGELTVLDYYIRGDRAFDEGKCDDAIEKYNKCIREFPYYEGYYYSRGNAYAKQGKDEEAIKDFDKAIELKPNYSKAYYSRGMCFAKLGNYTSAIEDFSKFINQRRYDADGYNARGYAYLCDGKYNKAKNDFTEAVNKDPRFAVPHMNLGTLYQKTKDLENALKEYTAAIALDQNYEDAYIERAKLYRSQGNNTAALDDEHMIDEIRNKKKTSN
ncbi:MAG: tetratricopeptide repeat protein [Clostridia bacterium]|nr:tetratricopeptide repeat protein [Clostridia bacterium]MBR6428330.1 tetratricopeptide repeat protein [Clostridia bacterium]